MRLPRLVLLALALVPARAAAGPTFTVNTLADAPDANPGDGACATAQSECSLRAAIMEANHQTDATVLVPGGATYTLTIAPGCANDAEECGDLNVTASMTITRTGASPAVVDANGLGDRALAVSGQGTVATITGVTFQNASSQFAGVQNRTATLHLVDCRVHACHATVAGGGISNGSGGTLTLLRTTVDACTGPAGGGVLNAAGNVTITDSVVSGNEATLAGGGLFQTDNVGTPSSTLVKGSLVSGNTAQDGGGVYNASAMGGALTIVNSTISGNFATRNGAGIYVESSTSSVLSNATVTNNQADSDFDGVGEAGGVYNAGISGFTVRNGILAGNFATILFNGQFYIAHTSECTGPIQTFRAVLQNYNTQKCTPGPTFTVADPKLGLLAPNGGRTRTHLLLAGSPAIDLGSGCVDENSDPLVADQRGVKRPIGIACDLGALELEPEGDVNGDGVVDVADVFALINFLFAGGPIPLGRANVNADAGIDVADAFYLINYLFAGGPPPQ
jgi:CSLREA domain-containing protein